MQPALTQMPIPKEIHGQKYILLRTFRKSGTEVDTPVWFVEGDDRLFVMTRNDSGKYKRIRNNPSVRVVPCTVRGKITGPEFAGTAYLLPPADWRSAKELLKRKYWLARLPFWSKRNEFLTINFAP
jgi:PPOX class probable F420-dependent enzyme